MKKALAPDGPVSGPEGGTVVRLLRLDAAFQSHRAIRVAHRAPRRCAFRPETAVADLLLLPDGRSSCSNADSRPSDCTCGSSPRFQTGHRRVKTAEGRESAFEHEERAVRQQEQIGDAVSGLMRIGAGSVRHAYCAMGWKAASSRTAARPSRLGPA